MRSPNCATGGERCPTSWSHGWFPCPPSSCLEPVLVHTLGRGGATSVIAMSERGTMFDPGPCVYMEKIAAGPAAADVIDLNAPVKANLEAVAKALGEKVSDVTAVILDRDRHTDLIRECRDAGARIRLIQDGDIAGAISVAWRNSGTDVLFGIGGTPEGVIAACALKCLGGSIQGRLY